MMSAEHSENSKSRTAYRTISEVAKLLGLETHVLRYWETHFSQVKPVKRKAGRRFYRPDDISVLREIQFLLYEKGYTIRGAREHLREQKAQEIAPKTSQKLAPSLPPSGAPIIGGQPVLAMPKASPIADSFVKEKTVKAELSKLYDELCDMRNYLSQSGESSEKE